MDAEYRQRLLAVNALLLGWALALFGVGLNVVWALHFGSIGFVFGAALAVSALAFAYFSEIAHIHGASTIGGALYMACAVATAGGLIVWLVLALALT